VRAVKAPSCIANAALFRCAGCVEQHIHIPVLQLIQFWKWELGRNIMNSKLMRLGFSALAIAAVSIFNMTPASFAEGVLSAGSEASCSEGFPVMTGPGATVLTPDGSYTVPGAAAKTAKAGCAGGDLAASDKHVVVGAVKYYSWNNGREQVTPYRARYGEHLSMNGVTY
jgi:hypothetical protein